MGTLWVRTESGNLIHVPVVGSDVNTPDSTHFVLTSEMPTANRCLDGTYTFTHDTLGSITVNFRPAGRSGTCNQCGQCCSHLISDCTESNCINPNGYIVQGSYHTCRHLVVKARGIGKSNGTECSIRATILDTNKGCAFFPTSVIHIVNCPACGFTFAEEV